MWFSFPIYRRPQSCWWLKHTQNQVSNLKLSLILFLTSFSKTQSVLLSPYYILSWSFLMTKCVSGFISRWIPKVERVLIGWMPSHSHSHTAKPTQVDRASFLISLLPSHCDYFSFSLLFWWRGPLQTHRVYKHSLAGFEFSLSRADMSRVSSSGLGKSCEDVWGDSLRRYRLNIIFWELFSGRNAQMLGLFQLSASWMIWFSGDKHKWLVNDVGDFGMMGINGCIERSQTRGGNVSNEKQHDFWFIGDGGYHTHANTNKHIHTHTHHTQTYIYSHAFHLHKSIFHH